MEGNVSPELSLAPQPEQSQDHSDSCPQGFGEGNGDQKEQLCKNVPKDLIEQLDRPLKTQSEVKKTWGFRQSTVAKREMPVEAVADSPENRLPVRRSGRQPKRTDKLEEFLSTAKRGVRKSTPAGGESGDPPSQTPTDAETASEASFDGNAESKTAEDKAESPERRTRSSSKKQAQRKAQVGRRTRSSGRAAARDEGSSDNEEDGKDAADRNPQKSKEKTEETSEDGGSVGVDQTQPEQNSEKEEAPEEEEEEDEPGTTHDKTEEATDDADKPASLMVKRGPIRTYVNKKKAIKKSTALVKPLVGKTAPVRKETKPKAAGRTTKPQVLEEDEDDDDDDDDSTSSSSSSSSSEESDDGGYDPNALYCICRQKHNKRFMICCDRCEEWFHGDCVGITEARGRLMERNGEDYICPNCTAKKNQLVRPATSILPTSAGAAKPKADAAASGAAERVSAAGASSTPSAALSFSAGEDLGIKGRIEKATNPTGKKKIKIFQPQVVQQPGPAKTQQQAAAAAEATTASSAEQKAAAADSEQRIATVVEVKTTPTGDGAEERCGQRVEEDATVPRCIGPGCDNVAQPDSVYCGNDCILRHAAAAMKSISDVKEPKTKDKSQTSKSAAQWSGAGGQKRKSREDSDSEEDRSPDPDEDDEDEHAEEHRPPPTTASWSSDHNYIAVTPEKTTAISPTVLNKKCMYLFKSLQLVLKRCCCFSSTCVLPVPLNSFRDDPHMLERT